MLPYGQNLLWCWLKATRCRRLYIIWLYLYEPSKIRESRKSERRLVLRSWGERKEGKLLLGGIHSFLSGWWKCSGIRQCCYLYNFVNVLEDPVGWRHGSVVKSTNYSCREPGLVHSTHIRQVRTATNSSCREFDALFWSPWASALILAHSPT